MKYLWHDIKRKLKSLFYCDKRFCCNKNLLKKVLLHKACKLKYRFTGKSSISERTEYSQWLAKYEYQLDKKIRNYPISSKKPEFIIVLMISDRENACFRQVKQSLSRQYYTQFSVVVFASSKRRIKDEIGQDKRFILIECSPELMHKRCNEYLFSADQQGNDRHQLVVFLGAGSLLSPFALNCLVIAWEKNPELKLCYADEDYLGDAGIPHSPVFKPDWDLFLFRSQNYWGGMVAWQMEFFHHIGGFNCAIDDGMMRDSVFRGIEVCDVRDIVHLPSILSHRDERYYAHGEMTISSQKSALQQRLQEHLSRTATEVNEILSIANEVFQLRYTIREQALVSIIIPTRNGYQILKQCVDSLLALTNYSYYELIIVNNQSDEPLTLNYLSDLSAQKNIKVLNYDQPFNFSAINNFAVEQANGSILVFLNNDVEVLEPQWLTALIELVQQPGVGAVGAKLLYPDGMIQHAGVILGLFDIACHVLHRAAEDRVLPMHRMQVVQSYTALTAACLAVKKEDFLKVNGFNDSRLKVAFNDVDFCLKLFQLGKVNLWTPYARLCHYESLTRGYEETPEKKRRFEDEIAYMDKQWSDILSNDPMYNPNLSLTSTEFQLTNNVRWFF